MGRRMIGEMALAGLLLAGMYGTAVADNGEKIKISSFVDEVKLSGDLRIREETRWYQGDVGGKGNTNRQRYRLRMAGDIREGDVIVHIRLASGTGEQVSTNQSMQKLSSQKGLWIDRAYVESRQIPNAVLMAGRMKNPFFQNKTTAIVFDDDYNPEGFAESYSMNLNETGSVFLTAGEIVLDGGGSGSAAQWLLGVQGGTEIKTKPAAFNLAVMYYTLANGTDGTFSQATVQDGNTRKADGITLLNPFHVIHGTAGGSFKIIVPVRISVDVVHNLADTDQGATTNENTGFAGGIVIGKASDPNTAEVGFEYRMIDADATLADLSDSDFGPNGGTNRKGFKVWTAYNLTKYIQTKLTVFDSKVSNEDLPIAPITSDEVNPSHFRLQGDVVIKY